VAWEKEIRGEDSHGVPKEYDLRTFVHLFLVNGDEYWHHVAVKHFVISTQLHPPTLFLIFTMKPYCPDYQAVKRGDGIFADSAMGAIISKPNFPL
jgi:hypothetical protein